MSELTTTPTETKSDFLSRPLLATASLDWEKAIYVAFVLLAILTRFWDLGSRVMSHDESLHTQFSYQFYNGDGYSHTPLMHGPFLFHITAVSYWLFGASDLAARLPVAIFGVILVAMPYLLRRWMGRIGALFASLIFLISPYITYYSRYIRHDIYVIVWALIVFIAIWQYLRQPDEKYLWWFAGGLALMFATKEVAFIYVAIFGSFLVLRLLSQIGRADWFGAVLARLRPALLATALGALLIGGGFIGQKLMAEDVTEETAVEATEGFAADPTEEIVADDGAVTNRAALILRWTQIGGVVVLSAGLFLAAREMRPHIDDYPEFDLIVLFTTLILPAISPLLTTMAGWDPRDYTVNTCMLEGQEAMSSLQLLIARMGNSVCWSSYLDSGIVHSGLFLVLMLAVAVLIGLWWNRRRWLITAVIFHTVFALLFTSVFTNPGGWASGMIGSLGYWLEQQGVERGSQPTLYYFFVVPFYEFLPVIFSFLAMRLWAQKQKINKITGYWLGLILLSLLAYSLSAWAYNRSISLLSGETTRVPGLLAGGLLLGVGILYWFFVRQGQLQKQFEVARLTSLVDIRALFDFVPMLIWWLLLTWAAYSYAGEKMPWLSAHFVIPMAFLAGWYFNEKLRGLRPDQLLSRPALGLMGITAVFIIAVLLALGPVLLGKIEWGNQNINNLNGIGRFLGSLIAAGGVYYLWRQARERVDSSIRRPIFTLSVFGLLSLLTIRFAYMAAFPNADYTTEFMVYAHGAPATKNTVLEQLETLSMRQYGDKSIKVAFDNDVSWPFTWYLRDYPNRVYFGENPTHSLTESPVVLVGSLNWSKVEPYLGNNYVQRTYTFLWWPMEEYRKIWGSPNDLDISWNAIFGDPNHAVRRGLGNRDVRQALWDIFFYRDYTKYGEVFGGSYATGEWPLRHEMRMYVRKDMLADLWDYGIGAVNAVGLEDPYAEKELALAPVMALNESGQVGTGPGQFNAPRNVAVAGDDRIYVLDSGNHRLQVFDANGQFLNGWGSQGEQPGQFNEPWGLAVDEQFVYVADTWNHRIQKFTLDGEFVTLFGRSGSPTDEPDTNGLGLFFGPRDIALLPDNRLLITDTGNHRLQVADRNGNFLNQIGNFGNVLGQFNEPVGLGTGPDGLVYLADTWNGRIQQFGPDLFALNEWPVDAWAGQSINNKPYTAVDSAGRIYVTDPESYRILIFNSAGEYLGRFGSFGAETNRFGLPNGIAIDAQDNIYIADAGNNRVLKFAPAFGAPHQTPSGEGGGEDAAANGNGLSDENAPPDSGEDGPAPTAPESGGN